MTGRTKNLALFIVLLALAGITVFLLTGKDGKEESGGEKDHFSMDNVNSAAKIILEGPGYRHVLTRENQENKRWQINHRYPVDESLIEALRTVLQKVMIRRPVAAASKENTSRILAERGVKVAVYGEDGQLLRAFTVAGSVDREKTYFYDAQSKEAYVMYIPGYDSYLAGLFELGLNDWRDRLIFSSNWRSLRSVSIDYVKDTAASFGIVFEKDFFKVPGVAQVDTAMMMGYLEHLEYIKAEKVLGDVNDPASDSLLKAAPFLAISVKDIDTTKNNTLYLYPRTGKGPYVMGSDENGRLMLIRYADIAPLLTTRDTFRRK